MWRLRLTVALMLGLVPGSSVVRGQSAGDSALPAALARVAHVARGPVEAEMHNVDYHIDDRVVLRIGYLRGALRPTSEAPPWFDDPGSFTLAIDTATVAMTPASLSALLNDYVFNYEGSPLKRLVVTIERDQLKQTGRLHKGIDLPFTILATVSTTPDGRLRLHPTSVKVLGVSVKGLMRRFGIELESLVRVRKGRGVEIAGDDFLLAPAELLPPPRIEGRLAAVSLGPSEVRQVFGSPRKERHRPLRPSDPKAANYMFYRGSILRFGKLTMADADLQIIDADPEDPFDFSLAHLNEQLVAGESHNQPDFGLVTLMPDYDDLRRPARAERRSNAIERSQ
jgi:hypothetical protein